MLPRHPAVGSPPQHERIESMSTEINDALAAATEALAVLEKKHAAAVEQIEQTKKALTDFEEITFSKLVQKDLFEQEKARRYLTAQEALRTRLGSEISAAREKLRLAQREADRAHLPEAVAAAQAQVVAIEKLVDAARADLSAAFRRLVDLRVSAEVTAARAGLPVRLDPVTVAWAAVSGSEEGNAREVGLFADYFLVEVAKAHFAVGRIKESTRAVEARRVGEAEARIAFADLTEEEQQAAVHKSHPGLGSVGLARAPDEKRIVVDDYDPFGR